MQDDWQPWNTLRDTMAPSLSQSHLSVRMSTIMSMVMGFSVKKGLRVTYSAWPARPLWRTTGSTSFMMRSITCRSTQRQEQGQGQSRTSPEKSVSTEEASYAKQGGLSPGVQPAVLHEPQKPKATGASSMAALQATQRLTQPRKLQAADWSGPDKHSTAPSSFWPQAQTSSPTSGAVTQQCWWVCPSLSVLTSSKSSLLASQYPSRRITSS